MFVLSEKSTVAAPHRREANLDDGTTFILPLLRSHQATSGLLGYLVPMDHEMDMDHSRENIKIKSPVTRKISRRRLYLNISNSNAMSSESKSPTTRYGRPVRQQLKKRRSTNKHLTTLDPKTI